MTLPVRQNQRHLSMTDGRAGKRVCGASQNEPAWHFAYMHPTQWRSEDVCVSCVHVYAEALNEENDWGFELAPHRPRRLDLAWECGWSLAVRDIQTGNRPLYWAHQSFSLRPDGTNAWQRNAFWRGYVEAVGTASGH